MASPRLRARLNRRFHLRHRWYLLLSHLSPRVREMERLRGVGTGRRCVLIGNGPSLRKVDPGVLRNEVTFGVNAIYLAEEWLGFLPTYHVTEDELVIEDRGAEISRMVGPTKFYHRRYRRQIPPNGTVLHPNILYDYGDFPGFPKFSRDAAKCLWTGGTVSYLCMQLAFYMGFDPVVLVGFDHHYVRPDHVTGDADIWKSHGDDPNHFDPDYFGNGRTWYAPCFRQMDEAFIRTRAAYESEGRRIWNATEGGRLEIFERRRFSEVFGH